ncbi:unnamed protein product [Protopolystoma xenopodis]|uniref:Uncharacterized protein n=1 Tax=Protopolystoma xenopodis TaxID=117903 RepID=A0A3S5CGK8_9PLAT|nr:unnamed protein product [Protopolystoma xenopodis]
MTFVKICILKDCILWLISLIDRFVGLFDLFHKINWDWAIKLYLEPLYDMKVIYVAITLLGTCFVLILIISILQYLEVRKDRTEKMQEAQRFHFDAM